MDTTDRQCNNTRRVPGQRDVTGETSDWTGGRCRKLSTRYDEHPYERSQFARSVAALYQQKWTIPYSPAKIIPRSSPYSAIFLRSVLRWIPSRSAASVRLFPVSRMARRM